MISTSIEPMAIERWFEVPTSDGYGWEVSGLTDTTGVKLVETGATGRRHILGENDEYYILLQEC